MQLEFDVLRNVKCHLHFSQVVEGEEGMSLYPCDAVALGDLSVAQAWLHISQQINKSLFSQTNIKSNPRFSFLTHFLMHFF